MITACQSCRLKDLCRLSFFKDLAKEEKIIYFKTEKKIGQQQHKMFDKRFTNLITTNTSQFSLRGV